MTIRPLNNQVAIRRLPLPTHTQSGLELIGREQPQSGIVIGIGPGAKLKRGGRHAIDLKEGQTVLFPKFAGCPGTIGHWFKLDGEDILLIPATELLISIDMEEP